jgi:uncharacterized DUF497 family protein
MKVTVEWDPVKARTNQRKHNVAFEEAATVFNDPLSFTIPDPLHTKIEERFIIIGMSIQQWLLVVVHTDRGDKIRIISARIANTHERKAYEETN